jgi:hypothetical protein
MSDLEPRRIVSPGISLAHMLTQLFRALIASGALCESSVFPLACRGGRN